MSQLMERWPWPTKKQSSSDPCAYQPPAVKLVLWASPEDDPFRPPSKPASEGGLVGGGLQLQHHHHQQKTRRRWSKLPLRPFPTSLSAKMGWLTGQTDSSAVQTPANKQNAVFRSNSFRFERPPPEDAEVGRIRGPIKSYSITAQDIASNVNEKYETPKDPVSHRPLRQPLMTQKYQRSIKGFYNYKGIHLNTMESNPVDVVYSDPKDSKLYQTPGTDPPRPLPVTSAPPPQPLNDVLCKMYVTARESQYMRPYVTMRSFQPSDDNRLVSDYEEVNSSNCVTMIAVMPAGSGNGNTATLASQPENLGKSTPDSTSLLASRSETSSSEGGSFIIDPNSFYENLNFHRSIRTSMVRSSSEITPEDAGSHPDLSKFGYSQKEVWNWLYTEQDLNHNLRVVGGGPRPPKDSKAVEVKFTLSEFVTCYKRLMGLNLEGFSEFVNRTLEALISTSMMVQKTMTTDKRKCYPSTHPNVVQVPSNTTTTTTTTSLLRSASRHPTLNPVENMRFHEKNMHSHQMQPGQNKTYVRLSVKRPPEKKAFSCYQTLMDVHPSNRAESVILEDMLSQYGRQLSIDLSQPLDRQEWYHGSITRHEAENALRLHEEGSFLVRNSESSSRDYSLSVKTARGFMHMKIQKPRDQAYILGQFSKPFKTIAEMLLYYSRNSLPVKGAEHISLKKPVCEQLL